MPLAPPVTIATAWLLDYEEALIALDAPLGWPQALGANLVTHRAGVPLRAEANQLFRRATDDEIKNRLGKRSLRARQVSLRGGELVCEDAGDRVKIGGRAITYLAGEISADSAPTYPVDSV